MKSQTKTATEGRSHSLTPPTAEGHTIRLLLLPDVRPGSENNTLYSLTVMMFLSFVIFFFRIKESGKKKARSE